MIKLPGPHHGLRIGLLGGSFNPAHEGHLHVAETAMQTIGLDWVWWIVARGNPLKQEHGDFDERFESARAVTQHRPRMRVSDWERAAGISYTVDLIASVQQRAPSAKFVWLMGGDSLASFHKWKDWQAVASSLPVAVVARPGTQQAGLQSPFAQRFKSRRLPSSRLKQLPQSTAPAWGYLQAPLNFQSSTALRNQHKDS